MVEDYNYAVDFNIGLEMLGEQGAESIHTVSSQLEQTYKQMQWANCMKSMVYEQYRQIFPENIAI